ncbi:MAG: MFS transporter [Clostridia bacterium]|nr:MFS transporter [Clostridia bacterium]
MGEKFKKAIGVEGTFKDTVLPMIYYCFTNIFLGGGGYIISMYFSIFLTRVVGLDIEYAGFITMVAVVWDGINDPIMGIITDRTRSKYGRHRSYLKWGIPFVFISYIMLWNSFGLDGENHPYMTVAYFVFAYVLYKTAYTVIAVPHTAMLPELAPEYNKRTQYTSVSYIFNSVGMIPSYIILLIMLSLFGFSDGLNRDAKMPFFITGIILAVMYSIAIYGTFKLVKEPSSLDMKNPPLDLKAALKEYVLVFKSRSFRQYFGISFFWETARSFYSTTYIYYVTFLANQYKFYPIFNTFAGIFESLAFPLNYALTMKHGKKKCGTIVTPFMIFGLAIGLVVTASQPGTPKGTFMLILMIMGVILYPFGMSGIGFVCNNVFPDLTDVDELITGRRREGVVSTCNTMVKQVTGGINTFIVTLILGGFGLDTNSEATEFVEQPASAIMGIRLCVALIPMISALISYILLRKFEMTKDDHTMIRAAIATKHKYGSVTLTDEERKRCEILSGQKLEDTWLGKDNDESQGHTLDKDENGNYIILIEKELEKKALMEKVN